MTNYGPTTRQERNKPLPDVPKHRRQGKKRYTALQFRQKQAAMSKTYSMRHAWYKFLANHSSEKLNRSAEKGMRKLERMRADWFLDENGKPQ